MAPEPTSIPALRLDSLLADTLRAEDISGEAIELAEAGLDQFLTDGMIRDVPVIGPIIAALKAGRAVRDYLFLRKLLAFLDPLKDVDPQQRGRMITRLESDPAFGERVGERLLMLLERLDSLAKPCMLGRAFHAYLTEKLTPQPCSG